MEKSAVLRHIAAAVFGSTVLFGAVTANAHGQGAELPATASVATTQARKATPRHRTVFVGNYQTHVVPIRHPYVPKTATNHRPFDESQRAIYERESLPPVNHG